MKQNCLILSYIWLIVFPCAEQKVVYIHEDSQMQADKINSMNSSWVAEMNVEFLKQLELYRNLSLVPKDATEPSTLPRAQNFDRFPEFFDSRAKWRKCYPIITRVRNQGSCGSCWAVSAASVISDRICIGTNGITLFHASAEDILSCCPNCPGYPDNICAGGYGVNAFLYWKMGGVVSGGELHSNEGCKPYSLGTSDCPKQMPCLKRCTNPNYRQTYDKDKIYGKTAYRLGISEKEIMYDMLKNGPVMALMVVYDDYVLYEKGVYRYNNGKQVTNHFVKLIGWGVDNGQKYWLGINTWGEQWGMGGYFKILKGINHCSIETEVSAAKFKVELRPFGGANALEPSFYTMWLFTFVILYNLK